MFFAQEYHIEALQQGCSKLKNVHQEKSQESQANQKKIFMEDTLRQAVQVLVECFIAKIGKYVRVEPWSVMSSTFAFVSLPQSFFLPPATYQVDKRKLRLVSVE